MTEKSGWKERQKREIENAKDPSPDIKKNVKGTTGIFNLMAEMMELYMSKIFEMIISLIGGSHTNNNEEKK